MKLSDLKLKEIRKIIKADINGDLVDVHIYNLMNEDRAEFKEKMRDINMSIKETVEELYTDLFEKCTNIEIDEDVIEVINNPDGNMLKILEEVLDIFNEIQVEILLENYNKICEIEKATILQLMALKGEKIDCINKKCEKEKKEIELLKEGD